MHYVCLRILFRIKAVNSDFYIIPSILAAFLLATRRCVQSIEIIDIECVLLSFLSKKIVSTKWRIYKGILVGPRLLRQGISRGCRKCELFFSTAKFAKIFISRLKIEKSFTKKKKCLNTHSSGLFYEKQQF